MYRILVMLIALLFALPAPAQGPTESGPPFRRDGDRNLESGPFFSFLNNQVYEYGAAASRSGKVFVVVVQEYRPGSKGPLALDHWRDPRVGERLQARGMLAAIYTGESYDRGPNVPGPALRRFATMPRGLYAIRNGEVADHTSQPNDVDALLAWLDLVATGGPSLEEARKLAGEREDGGPLLPRLVLAMRLDLAGKADEAGAEYEWVLEQTLLHDVQEHDWSEPKSIDRTSARSYPFLKRGAEFAKQNQAAMARIVALRDAFAARTDAATDEVTRSKARRSFFLVYDIAPNPDQLLAWFKRQPPEPAEDRRDSSLSLRREVFHKLTAAGRWADAGNLVDKPLGWTAQAILRISATEWMTADDRRPERDREKSQARFHAATEAGIIYAALLAAGRENHAQAVAEVLEELDAEDEDQTVRKGLILWALQAGQARPIHLQWADELDETQPADKKIKPKVEEALRPKPVR
jgi:hypothetical protein